MLECHGCNMQVHAPYMSQSRAEASATGPALAIIYIYLLAAHVRRILARVGECGAARHSAPASLTGWDQLLQHQLLQTKSAIFLPPAEGTGCFTGCLSTLPAGLTECRTTSCCKCLRRRDDVYSLLLTR